jgi:hypothetical protein
VPHISLPVAHKWLTYYFAGIRMPMFGYFSGTKMPKFGYFSGTKMPRPGILGGTKDGPYFCGI